MLVLVAMNFAAGANNAMAGLMETPAMISAQGHASAMHHHQHAADHAEAAIAAPAHAQTDCPSHRDGSADGANCCAAGCLLLGLPVELLPTFALVGGSVFLRPAPQFVASATPAHLRPPRA